MPDSYYEEFAVDIPEEQELREMIARVRRAVLSNDMEGIQPGSVLDAAVEDVRARLRPLVQPDA